MRIKNLQSSDPDNSTQTPNIDILLTLQLGIS